MYYKTISPDDETVIIRMDGDVVTSFTENPENSDYQRYLEWVAAGGVPEPWSP